MWEVSMEGRLKGEIDASMQYHGNLPQIFIAFIKIVGNVVHRVKFSDPNAVTPLCKLNGRFGAEHFS
jgi:hypothetical protein